MRDPRYSPILLQIESVLHDADKLASSRGITLTDSNIRSLLVRAINEAKGKAANSVPSAASAKEHLLAEMVGQLASVRAAIVKERDQPDGSVARCPISAAEWIAALEAIKDSCAARTSGNPGSRGYLEFLQGFLKG